MCRCWPPQEGRSALDGVEALNYMTNLMREHMDDAARIHYVITRGGEAPNVLILLGFITMPDTPGGMKL